MVGETLGRLRVNASRCDFGQGQTPNVKSKFGFDLRRVFQLVCILALTTFSVYFLFSQYLKKQTEIKFYRLINNSLMAIF